MWSVILKRTMSKRININRNEYKENNDRLLRRDDNYENDDDNDDGDLHQKIQDHNKCAYVKYIVTHEIKI